MAVADEAESVRQVRPGVESSGFPPYFRENVVAGCRHLESLRSADGRFSSRGESFVEPADQFAQTRVRRLASDGTRKQICGGGE